MNPQDLLSELDACTERLAQTMASFSEDEFNRQPSPGQWSAGQVAEHLLLLEKAAGQALNGAAIPTNRPADEKAGLIKKIMEDDTPRHAPDVVKPSGQKHSASEWLTALKTERDKLKATFTQFNVTDACTSLKHPGFGTLTRWEWVSFLIHHTERHRRQMERQRNG